MFAVIKAGGKQYRVMAEDVIRIDRVAGEPGEVIEFGEVLLLGGDTPTIGSPTIAGATVAGEVVQHTRGDKVIAFKKRRRKNSRRKRGFRHDFSVIRITEILTDGAKPSKTLRPGRKKSRSPRSKAKPRPRLRKRPRNRPPKRPKSPAPRPPLSLPQRARKGDDPETESV